MRVVTLRYNEALQGFLEEVLCSVAFGREVLNVTRHFFVHCNIGFKPILKDMASKEGSASGVNRVKRGGNWNNNGFRLVSTMSEQTGFHFDTSALRRCGDEHAYTQSASNASDRCAGDLLEGVNEK